MLHIPVPDLVEEVASTLHVLICSLFLYSVHVRAFRHFYSHTYMHGTLQLPDHMTLLLRAGQLRVTVVPSDLNFDGNMNLLDVCTDTFSSATYRNTLQHLAT